MRNSLHVEAPLLAVVGEPEGRPVIAAEHRKDRGRAIDIRETDRPEGLRKIPDILVQTRETLGLVPDDAQASRCRQRVSDQDRMRWICLLEMDLHERKMAQILPQPEPRW